jgi:hypothetical protein
VHGRARLFEIITSDQLGGFVQENSEAVFNIDQEILVL